MAAIIFDLEDVLKGWGTTDTTNLGENTEILSEITAITNAPSGATRTYQEVYG